MWFQLQDKMRWIITVKEESMFCCYIVSVLINCGFGKAFLPTNSLMHGLLFEMLRELTTEISTLQNLTKPKIWMPLSVPFMSLICPLGGLLSNMYVSVIEQISFPAPDPIFITHNLVVSNSFKGFTGLNSECINIREYFHESCLMPWLPHCKTSALLVIFHPVLFCFLSFFLCTRLMH